MQVFEHKEFFRLECGVILPEIKIAYQTWGRLNEARNNVIWVCHALTANSDVSAWWPGMIGPQKAFDTDRYFVICANIPGSCYGSTGPLSTNPKTGEAWYKNFPLITIRDMVKAFQLLRLHLGIEQIDLLVGGSLGGYQALEWSVMEHSLIKHLFLIATSAKESAWGIAIHTTQRLAIEADQTWAEQRPDAGSKGLKVARAIGMLTYRSYEAYAKTQTDADDTKLDHFKASSYIEYQGSKLVQRFNAYSYWVLTKSMDTHNVARDRGDIKKALQYVTAKTLIIGITSDLLCPLEEQQFLAAHIPQSKFVCIDSVYGHDGFLVETGQITEQLLQWLTN